MSNELGLAIAIGILVVAAILLAVSIRNHYKIPRRYR